MIRRACALGVLLLALTGVSASARTGDLDPDFGGSGRFTYEFDDLSASATAPALQTNGKILLAGTAGRDFAVIRLQADGSLDRSFGHQGVTIVDFGHPKVSCQLDFPCGGRGFATATAIAVQPNGRIVVGGTTYVRKTDFDFAAARLRANGKLDKSFSRNGKATIDIGQEYDWASDMQVLPDGKIVLAGRQGDENTTDNVMALARLTASGRPDSSFGHGGVSLLTVGRVDDDRINAIALQPDGKLVAAGDSYQAQGYEPIVVRFNADGSLDRAFGSDGYTIVGFGGDDDGFRAVGLQSTGAIVLAGYASVDGPMTLPVARLTPGGDLDTSFSDDGRELIGYPDGEDAFAEASDLEITPEDRIVLGAYASHDVEHQDVGVIRLLPDGGFDSSFGTDGRLEAGLRPDVGQPADLALQPDGAIVLVTGTCAQKQQFCNRYQFAAVRFTGG